MCVWAYAVFMSECKYRVNIVYVYIMDLCTYFFLFVLNSVCLSCFLLDFILSLAPGPVSFMSVVTCCLSYFLTLFTVWLFLPGMYNLWSVGHVHPNIAVNCKLI